MSGWGSQADLAWPPTLGPPYAIKQTWRAEFGGSALCQFRTHAPQQTAWLFDDLVGEREQRRRHGEAERLGRVGVDHQVELGGLHDRQVSGLLALENPADINAGP